MHARRRADETRRWCVSATAAMLVHSAVVFALPDASPRNSRASAAPTWMSLIVGGDGSAGSTASPHLAYADSKADASPRRDTRTRTRRARDVRVSAPSKSEPAPTATRPEHAMEDGVDALASAADAAPFGARAASNSLATMTGLAPASGGLGSSGNLRGPGLLPVASPCRGFFPIGAKADHGQVQIHVHVDASGRARFHQLLAEEPRGQGFGSAAAACASALRFAPALNGEGIAIAGSAKLELRFDRS